jgi:3-dehydroquinate dehydratase-2
MSSEPKKILIINGPNLNMLGTRQPEIYGDDTLADIQERCEAVAESLGLEVDFKQSNSEGEIINLIHSAKEYQGLIINAAGYTHTSVAIFDALLMLEIPVIEVHISNIYKREDFRHKSLISPAASGIICGFGVKSYELALKSFV